MISFVAAQAILQQAAGRLPAETVAIADALGRIAAAPVLSRETIPPSANSACDALAVRAADIADASASVPSRLPVRGLTAAGDAPAMLPESIGTAWRIMTGAPMPSGYDTVLAIETVQLVDDDNSIVITESAPRGQHV